MRIRFSVMQYHVTLGGWAINLALCAGAGNWSAAVACFGAMWFAAMIDWENPGNGPAA